MADSLRRSGPSRLYDASVFRATRSLGRDPCACVTGDVAFDAESFPGVGVRIKGRPGCHARFWAAEARVGHYDAQGVGQTEALIERFVDADPRAEVSRREGHVADRAFGRAGAHRGAVKAPPLRAAIRAPDAPPLRRHRRLPLPPRRRSR